MQIACQHSQDRPDQHCFRVGWRRITVDRIAGCRFLCRPQNYFDLCHRPAVQHHQESLVKAQPRPPLNCASGQLAQPAQHRLKLAAHERRVGRLCYQVGRFFFVAGRQGMADGFTHEAVGPVPGAGPLVKAGQRFGLGLVEAPAQQFGKQVMVSEPAFLLVQGEKEQITPL